MQVLQSTWKVRELPMWLQFLLMQPCRSEPVFMGMHPAIFEIFQSGPRWWKTSQYFCSYWHPDGIAKNWAEVCNRFKKKAMQLTAPKQQGNNKLILSHNCPDMYLNDKNQASRLTDHYWKLFCATKCRLIWTCQSVPVFYRRLFNLKATCHDKQHYPICCNHYLVIITLNIFSTVQNAIMWSVFLFSKLEILSFLVEKILCLGRDWT